MWFFRKLSDDEKYQLGINAGWRGCKDIADAELDLHRKQAKKRQDDIERMIREECKKEIDKLNGIISGLRDKIDKDVKAWGMYKDYTAELMQCAHIMKSEAEFKTGQEGRRLAIIQKVEDRVEHIQRRIAAVTPEVNKLYGIESEDSK